MIILLDIGNTSVTYGLYGSGRLRRKGSCSIYDIPKIIINWSKNGELDSSNHIVISSVVPYQTCYISKRLKRRIGFHVWVVGENLPIRIKSRYKPIKSLGTDRIVNIYGALRIYSPPILIVDYGTAVTFDYVSAKGVFEGGMIIPGPEISYQALLDRAALIPKSLKLPTKSNQFLGHSTFSCMSSGILEGYGSMTDALVNRYKSRYGNRLRVLGTGGFSITLKQYTKSFDIHDPDHSLKSILILFKDFQANNPS
ncbi:MAG: type III pantothenate kinase [Candidatus Omnitrophica bacterium]|nr:type III pantothenate kinase [Candidatus Omnitrophota bacterium]